MGLSEPCQMKIYMLSKSHKCMAKRKRQPFLLCMCVCAHEHIYAMYDVMFVFALASEIVFYGEIAAFCCFYGMCTLKNTHTPNLSLNLLISEERLKVT